MECGCDYREIFGIVILVKIVELGVGVNVVLIILDQNILVRILKYR